MKKYIPMLMVLSMFILPMVSAGSYWMDVTDTLELVEKDSSWNMVEEGARGIVTFSVITRFNWIIQQRVRVSVWGLEPKTKYQLIYYGDETHNDEWPYATCIGRPRRTNTKGYFRGGSTRYDHLWMKGDGIPQKLWVVPSSDVDCKNGIMTGWNPSEYLFETNTV